jgi:predicted signal transduction protein with EAL and GGDEF domain
MASIRNSAKLRDIWVAHDSSLGANGQSRLKDAYIALKRAKKNCRGGYVRFTQNFGIEVQERGRLLQGLRAAVKGNRLFVVYQPQIRLMEGEVLGMEALLRWRTD